MALLSDYTAGTATIAGVTVTGSGTGWETAQFNEGDIFIAAGYWAIVASVDSNTSLTLVDWAGGDMSGVEYRLRYMSDGSRASAQARQLIDMLGGSGNLEALSGLVGLPDHIPVFTGAGTMELRSYTAGLVPRGEWDVDTEYNPGDLVIHGGNVFASLTENNLGNEPPATQTTDANWMYVPVAPGPEGPPGPSAPLTIGTVQQGTNAAASITGTVPNQQLNLTLPRGQKGDPGIQGEPGIQGNPGPANSLSIGTVSTGSTAGATITGTAPTQTLNLTLPRGLTGDPGSAGWTPVFAIVADGARYVQEVVDWVGGTGDKPDVGVYVGADGFVEDIIDAVNIRGASGSGTGDMQAVTYDPQNIAGDAFLRSNMTGEQAISTITGLQTALNGKFNNPSGATTEYIRGDGSVALFPAIPAGTVTSVALSAPTGFSVGGSPVTSSGTLSLTYASGYTGFTTALQTKLNGIEEGATANATDAQLRDRSTHTGTQLAATISNFSTAADARISAAVGSTVQAYSAQLAALAALNTTGLFARTAANTVAARTITGASGQINVLNGDGVSGNPELSLGSSVARLSTESQPLTGGATVTSKDLGTITTGTVTANAGHRPQQHYVNNGPHTLAAGVANGSYLLDITNGASAGVITAAGWTKVAGDSFTTASGDKFRCHCSIGPAGSLLIVQALQ